MVKPQVRHSLFFGVFLAHCFFLFLQTSAQAKPIQIKWLVADDPIGVFNQTAVAFKKEIESESKGEIQVQLKSSKKDQNQRWFPIRVLRKVMKGKQYHMAQSFVSTLGIYSNPLWALEAPFLFRDYEHVEKVIASSIGQELLDGLKDRNMEGLAFFYGGGFRILPTRTKKLKSMQSIKGLWVGATVSPVSSDLFEEMGGLAVPKALSKRLEYAKKGLIDGIETTYPSYLKYADVNVLPIINETNHSLFLTAVVINRKFMNRLSKRHQGLIRDVAKRVGIMERSKSIAEFRQARESNLKKGVKIHIMSRKERIKAKKMVGPLYSRFEDLFGKSLVKRIEAVR